MLSVTGILSAVGFVICVQGGSGRGSEGRDEWRRRRRSLKKCQIYIFPSERGASG